MISIIICSINPTLCNTLGKNIENTIGIAHEIIIFDNRDKNWAISKVYNHCAEQAKFDFLCFIHEDILFLTNNWGDILTSFADKTKNCGLIGFAGGRYVPRNFVTWGRLNRHNKREHIIQKYKNENEELIDINPDNEQFARTITLDGVFLFVKKSIWENIRFDEEKFNAFHFYDADFSFAVAQHFENYVCALIDIKHMSIGTLNMNYCDSIITFRDKWKSKIPMSLSALSKISRIKEELNSANFTITLFRKNKFSTKEIYKMIRKYNSVVFIFILLIYRQIINVPQKFK